ncbi:MAG: M20/M25/M40 family metallo-hydrolase [Myxococcales bacterium]|nr:M20/M25/M40 family metallo-hydrolase [Myxococcales bacterium]
MCGALSTVALAACSPPAHTPRGGGDGVGTAAPPPVELRDPREAHLGSLIQLSNGGENAEAYWSFDGTQLIFQTTRDPYACDQIMRMPADGSADPVLVSTGQGRTTCSYFLKGDQEVIYASTHEVDAACPPPPDRSLGYVWALYGYNIYRGGVDGSAPHKLTDLPGYDAEATVCPVDGSIVFTSDRDGDLELYRMDADGKNVVRLTHTPGYDGGAFFNADCTKLVWRASRPTGDALVDYQKLLADHLVRPTQLEIYVGNADGTDARQITYLNAASFAPYFFPSSDRVIFSSNYGDPQGREFDLWAVDTDGTDLERITYSPGFDGFPMFSPDGTRLAFSSNRHNAKEGDTNVFVARWVDSAPVVDAPSAADRFEDAVTWLADDAREGRGVGTAGLAASTRWIEERLREAGVAGGMADGSFLQPFDVTTAVDRKAGTTLTVDKAAVAADAFVPLTFSSNGAVAGKTVYVGYGVEDATIKVHDYKGKNVKGKIVVVRRFVPDGKPYDDEATRRRDGDLHTKAITARLQGAIGMIVVDVPADGVDEAPLPALDLGEQDLGLPAIAITRAAGEALTRGRHAVALAVEIAPIKTTTNNVVGVIGGARSKDKGVIVVGAHYDHLGMGGRDSLEAKPGIHNGADDNASGVAALLEVARILVAHQDELDRPVYVVAFSGEEMGVLGSTHFVKHLPFAAPVTAMLNMDMVGRMRGNRLQVLGAESSPDWKALVEPACAAAGIDCQESGSGYGPSDHMPFYVAGSPVLHFFTGGHLDYHKTSDDAPLINAIGGAQVASVVAAVALATSTRAEAVAYQKVAPPPQGGDLRARGASMGTIPSYAEEEHAPPGVLISDVVPDGPAAKAGLRGGDRLVQIGPMEIHGIQDFMYVLTTARPGDTAKVTVLRDGKRVTVDVVYGKPRRR